MEVVLRENHGTRRLVAGWLLLAVSALALSTVYAVLVVVTRTPLLNSFSFTRELFRSALVLHVNFAVVVWLLVCAAGLWTLAAGGVGPVRRAALWLACSGAAVMAVAPVFGTPVPILSNYVPVLNEPIFLAGLITFVSGIALCGAASAGDIVRRLAPPILTLTFPLAGRGDKQGNEVVWRLGALFSIIAAAVALCSLGASMVATGVPVNQAGFEALFWGPGHILQFVHVLLMMAVWAVLGERVVGAAVVSQRGLVGLLLLAALPVLAAPFIHIFYVVDSPGFRHAYTGLMTWGIWPAPLLLGGRLLLLLLRAGRTVWAKAEMLPLALSLLLFALGCIFGAFIKGETTLVTAHYHGTVGAVAIVYMGLGYRLLPSFGYSVGSGRLARWQLAIYGSGLLTLASSLAWLGAMGVPRKTPHVDQAAQTAASMSAMGLMGVGGLLSLVGVALYVFSIGRSIWPRTRKASVRDVRTRALMLTAALVIAGGLLISTLPGRYNTSIPAVPAPAAMSAINMAGEGNATVANAENFPAETTGKRSAAPARNQSVDAYAAHAQKKGSAEIQQRFEQGVMMLHARRYDDAVTAFHRVLRLDPDMPEANVNIGYALLGLERYTAARDFFESAIELRKDQINAYYGLAEALEGLHDLPGAIGAMRTYQHLAPAEDAYRQSAEAMIKTWQDKRDQENIDSAVAK